MSTTLNVRSTATAACLALLLGVLAVFASVPSASASSALVVRGCNAYSGAKTLGTTYTDAFVKIYACGVRPSFDGAKKGTGPVVLPFAGSTTYYRGYQCIELVARYLQARFGALPGVANGAQAVDRYAAAYPATFVKISNGTKGKAPRKGDVLSLSANARFDDVGHTGVVISSSVSSAGNGTMRVMEENWGGSGGTAGYHNYAVKNWRVVYAGLPYIKWLRAR
jgi:hypothetical protein